jgi:rhodanese-related sulfurtransferase
LLDVAAVQVLVDTNPDVLLVDVRTSGEYGTAHVPGSVNLPLDQVDAHLRRIVADAGGALVLVCQSGGRAAQAHERLTNAGLSDIAVLEGGMNAWIAAGGPVDRVGQARWGLERQVRLVAGTLVSIAVLAGIVVPGLQYVAGAVGAGLALAAITDSCLMGMLLARLPYNRGRGADVEAAIARMSDPARVGVR